MKPVFRQKGKSLAGYIQSLNPFSYWKMIDESGLTSPNLGSSAEVLTYVGATLAQVDCPGGKAPWFDGVDDYATAAIPSWPGKDIGTVSVWAKVPDDDGWAGVDHGIFHLTNGGGEYHQIGIRLGNLGCQTGTWTGNMNVTLTGMFHDWMNVVVTHDALGDEQLYYFNGVYQDVSEYLFNTDPTWPVLIGCWEGPTGLFLGSICHLAFWDRVLTPTEIANIYNLGKL